MNTPELHKQIAERAYLIWQREGRQVGLDREQWLRAEQELAIEAIAERAKVDGPALSPSFEHTQPAWD